MELKEIFAEALEAVEAAGIPDDLRRVAFAKAIDLVASGVLAGERAALPGRVPPAVGGQDEGPLGRIARKLNLSTEQVEGVYHLDGESLGIGVATQRLASGVAPATKQLALLVAAGRQAGGFDADWTSSATIKAICQEFGRFDSSNFAKTIRSMGNLLNFRGRGQELEVKVLRPGWDEAARLVESLTRG